MILVPFTKIMFINMRTFIAASGVLKGYDALINLVLDNAVEYVRDTEDAQKMTEVGFSFSTLRVLDLIHLLCSN